MMEFTSKDERTIKVLESMGMDPNQTRATYDFVNGIVGLLGQDDIHLSEDGIREIITMVAYPVRDAATYFAKGGKVHSFNILTHGHIFLCVLEKEIFN